jgi:hypothetical protein
MLEIESLKNYLRGNRMRKEHVRLYELENRHDEIKTTLYYAWAVMLFNESPVKQLLSNAMLTKEITELQQQEVHKLVKQSASKVGYVVDDNEVYNILIGLVYSVVSMYKDKNPNSVEDIVGKPTYILKIEKIVGYHMDVYKEVRDLLNTLMRG